MSAPAELLPWDSEHFGSRIARVRHRRLSSDELKKIDCWCATEGVECLYLLADADHPATSDLAQQAGFRMVDLRLTLGRPLDAGSDGSSRPETVRPAHSDDLEHLRPIARQSHTDSRFYFDSRFPNERCRRLYERWIERSVEGWADTVLVAEHRGRAAGYASCHLRDGQTGSIGLVGIEATARGRGLGRDLVTAAVSWFAGRGLREVEVITQGRNVAAQRLYQAAGLRTVRAGIWFHRWTDRSADGSREP